MKNLVYPSDRPSLPWTCFRVELADGSTTSIVEPDYSTAVYMASLRWPGSVVSR